MIRECDLTITKYEVQLYDSFGLLYREFVLEVALPHVVVAHVVDDLLRELLRVGAHVPVHEQVAPYDLEAVLEHWDYCSWKGKIQFSYEKFPSKYFEAISRTIASFAQV